MSGVAMSKDGRPSAARRGYGTDWRRLRATIPAANCGCGARWHPGFHLDHIIARAKGGSDAPGNLRWTCRPCHSAKTAAVDGGFGNEARQDGRWRPRRAPIGVDGWPEEYLNEER